MSLEQEWAPGSPQDWDTLESILGESPTDRPSQAWAILSRLAGEIVAQATPAEGSAANLSNSSAEELGNALVDLVEVSLRLVASVGDRTLLEQPDARNALADTAACLGLPFGESVVQEVRGQLSAFRHAAALWPGDCEGLAPLQAAPPTVLDAGVDFLQRLALLRKAEQAARDWYAVVGDRSGSALLDRLARQLSEAAQEAADWIRSESVSSHLWPLGAEMRRLGITDLVEPFVVAASKPETRAIAQTGAQENAFLAVLRRADVSGDEELVGHLMHHLVAGHLDPTDREAVRIGIAHDPARWALAHRAELKRNGFTPVVPLGTRKPGGVQLEVPQALRLQQDDYLRLLPPARSNQALLPDGQAADLAQDQREASSLADLGLASCNLALTGQELHLVADSEGGLRCIFVDERKERRCAPACVQAATATHAGVTFPMLVLDEDNRVLRRFGFRPGPFREALTRQGKNLDRAFSPQAYVMTVGDSILRNLFGWSKCSEQLHALAQTAGYSGTQLRELLESMELEHVDWLRQIPLAGAKGTLADLPSRWDQVEPEVSAELGTLYGLPDALRPVAGDVFALVPTATASSLLAAWLLGSYLRHRVPEAQVKVCPCSGARQDPDISQPRFLLSAEPVRDAAVCIDREIGALLVDDCADPMLIVSGGTKWLLHGALHVARVRHLPCVYLYSDPERKKKSVPIGFRCDRVAGVEESLPRPAASHKKPVVLVSVGTSLWTNRFGDQREVTPERIQQLREWAFAGGEAPAEPWRASAELTLIEGWRRRPTGAGSPRVALIPSETEIGAPCGSVLVEVLRSAGYEVDDGLRWRIPDLDGVQDMSAGAEMGREVGRRIRAAIEEIRRQPGVNPTVLVSGEQKLSAVVLHVVGEAMGCAVFFAGLPEKGQAPKLQEVATGSVIRMMNEKDAVELVDVGPGEKTGRVIPIVTGVRVHDRHAASAEDPGVEARRSRDGSMRAPMTVSVRTSSIHLDLAAADDDTGGRNAEKQSLPRPVNPGSQAIKGRAGRVVLFWDQLEGGKLRVKVVLENRAQQVTLNGVACVPGEEGQWVGEAQLSIPPVRLHIEWSTGESDEVEIITGR